VINATINTNSNLNSSKYNWKNSTIEAPKNQPVGSSLKMYQDGLRPSSINKSVIGGGNFQTLDPVELTNYNK
jgi:hypothetical protein